VRYFSLLQAFTGKRQILSTPPPPCVRPEREIHEWQSLFFPGTKYYKFKGGGKLQPELHVLPLIMVENVFAWFNGTVA